MSLLSELKSKGVDIKTNILSLPKDHTAVFKIDCPQTYCKSSRSTDDKTPLMVEVFTTDYAEWRCRHCLWSGKIGQKPAQEAAAEVTPIAAPKAPESLPPEVLAFLAAKGMTEDDAVKHKLSWDGRRKCVKIPYLVENNIINNLLIRIEDGSTKLEKPDNATFFGLHLLKQSSEPVTIAQREIDAIILMVRGIPNVLAIPNGGNVIDKADDFNKEPDRFGYLSRASELAKGWGNIRFAFDDTREALALRQELARRLGPGRCMAAKMTSGTVWETMTKNGADTVCADINEAKPLPISGLYHVNDFERELVYYYEHGMKAGLPTGWHNVDKLYTVMPGQLTVITGIPNSGKSEWLDALAVNLALNYHWRFAAFSPENGKEAHVVKLAEKRVEMSADPKAARRMTYDTLMAAAEWVANHFVFIENKETLPTLEWILERAKDAVLRYAVKGLIIDPWNRIEKVLNGKSETDYVAESIPKILRFAANYGVHVWLVVHPKQQMKDKTGKIPAPSLYDMAGSAHFVNMCDNGVVIHRSDSIDDTTEVLVRKVRFKHVGRRGEAKLRYNRTTGRFEPLDEEMTPEQLEKAEKYRAAASGDMDAIQTYEVD